MLMGGYFMKKKILFSFMLFTSLVTSIQAMDDGASTSAAADAQNILDDLTLGSVLDQTGLDGEDKANLLKWLKNEVTTCIGTPDFQNLTARYQPADREGDLAKKNLRVQLVCKICVLGAREDVDNMVKVLAPLFDIQGIALNIYDTAGIILERFFGSIDLRNKEIRFAASGSTHGTIERNNGTIYLKYKQNGAGHESVLVKHFPGTALGRVGDFFRGIIPTAVSKVWDSKIAVALLVWNIFKCVKTKNMSGILDALKTPAAIYCIRTAPVWFNELKKLIGVTPVQRISQHEFLNSENNNRYVVIALLLLSELAGTIKNPSEAMRATLLKLAKLALGSPREFLQFLLLSRFAINGIKMKAATLYNSLGRVGA